MGLYWGVVLGTGSHVVCSFWPVSGLVGVTLSCMAVSYTVHAESEAAVRVKLARLCVLMGAVPRGRPMLLPGREGEQWMARAVERPVTVRSRGVRPAGAV